MRRPRRNRATAAIRDLAQETTLTSNDLIFPLFLLEGQKKKTEVDSMPGIYRLSEDLLLKEIEECFKLDEGKKSIKLGIKPEPIKIQPNKPKTTSEIPRYRISSSVYFPAL